MIFFYKIGIVALIQGPKSPKNGPFWTENGRRIALFCKIAQLKVDLLAFYPENGNF